MELNDYLKLPYTIELRRDEDGDWIARIKELRGCTADGPSEAEALQDLKNAQREWIQAAIEDGVPIPLPEPEEALPSGKWVQRTTRKLHRDLKYLAHLEGISLNQLVSTILSQYVGETVVRRSAATQGQFTMVLGQTVLQTYANVANVSSYTITTTAGYAPASNITSAATLGTGVVRLPAEYPMMHMEAVRG